MFLAIDIGNSNVVIGLYSEDEWVQTWRINTITDSTAPVFYERAIRDLFFENLIPLQEVNLIGISSVVPNLNTPYELVLNNLFDEAKLLFIQPSQYNALGISVARPYEIGTDLIANAYAANQLFNNACIVVDFGTALSFVVVDEKCEILGVNIAPGIQTAFKTLSDSTAQLPNVELEYPSSTIGTNTNQAIQAGILVGYVGLVRHIIHEISKEAGIEFITIATGGLSSILKPLQEDFYSISSSLTLDGIRLITEKLK